MVEKQNVELKLIHMEDVVSKEVEWLWYPYIPYGKITIIEGDPGEGKTTLVLKLAAALSRGLPLPCDDDKEYEPIHIIYQTAEDGIEDTIKPRLEKAGADCSMIRVIDETDKELSMTDDRLEQAIIETKARLIILDPIQAYIGATVDMHELTKFATQNYMRYREFTWRGYSNNKTIVTGALKGEKKAIAKYGDTIETIKDYYPSIAKHISQLGSVMLLDFMREDYILDSVLAFCDSLAEANNIMPIK